MNEPRKPKRRSVKATVLMAAAAGAAVVTLANCGPFTSGNLIAPPQCGADAGPPNCEVPDCHQADGGPAGCRPVFVHDAGKTDAGDGGTGGDQ